uniref:Uncharacterized protein n=1 Tax=Rhizophora mucronata TaxID=61149 RepID=A0A2P2JBQ5_RHIMU
MLMNVILPRRQISRRKQTIWLILLCSNHQ